MCRLRISNWARRCVRENKLVDERRWRQIREAFPAQCQRRLAGEDEEEEEEEVLGNFYQAVFYCCVLFNDKLTTLDKVIWPSQLGHQKKEWHKK